MVPDKLLSVDHAANGILKVDSLNAAEKTENVDPCAGLVFEGYCPLNCNVHKVFMQFTYVGSVCKERMETAEHIVCLRMILFKAPIQKIQQG